MGIFQKTPYSIKWVKANSHLGKTDELKLENLFWYFMLILTKANIFIQDTKKIKEYYNDSSIFEIGIYFMFHIDIHLFKNYQNERVEIIEFFIDQYTKLFYQVFHLTNIPEIFNERINLYAKLYKDEKEDYDFAFFNYLLNSKNGNFPEIYNGLPSYGFPDIIEEPIFRQRVAYYQNNIFDASLEWIKKYISKK